MIADLNEVGKVIWLKEMLAKVEISSEKAELHDINNKMNNNNLKKVEFEDGGKIGTKAAHSQLVGSQFFVRVLKEKTLDSHYLAQDLVTIYAIYIRHSICACMGCFDNPYICNM